MSSVKAMTILASPTPVSFSQVWARTTSQPHTRPQASPPNPTSANSPAAGPGSKVPVTTAATPTR